MVEPYNSVLSTHALLEHTDVTFCLDNEVCARPLFAPSIHATNHAPEEPPINPID